MNHVRHKKEQHLRALLYDGDRPALFTKLCFHMTRQNTTAQLLNTHLNHDVVSQQLPLPKATIILILLWFS